MLSNLSIDRMAQLCLRARKVSPHSPDPGHQIVYQADGKHNKDGCKSKIESSHTNPSRTNGVLLSTWGKRKKTEVIEDLLGSLLLRMEK